MITNIPIANLRPHPGNPRKDLGDLSELAESIKAKGVLQNLTVVPQEPGFCSSCNLYVPSVGKCEEGHDAYERSPCSKWESAGNYTVVIGHRRLAAAKLAGLTELPCAVTDLSDKDQLAAMLLENIQRSDLTVYEQAQGFQMMMDLGDTVASIAEKTGFSESTVRRRVNLLDLDDAKFKKSVARGATLMDFAKLEEIKDPELRNKVLESVGTANFNYELKRAKDQEKEAEKKAAWVAELETFATQIEVSETGALKQIQWFSIHGKEDFHKPEDAGQRKYYFSVSYHITLYAEPTEQDTAEDTARNEQMQKQRERCKQLDQIAERTFQLRFDFVKGRTGLKKRIALIAEMAVQSMLLTGYRYNFDGGMFLDLLDLEPDENEEFDLGMIAGPLAAAPERVLLKAAYANLGDNPRSNYHNWQGAYEENEALDLVYGYLERLGYEMSDEERLWRNGEHAYYKADAVDAPAQPDSDATEA